eukprot:6212454-Pleurochrysis_carterae.AAC.1
MEEEQEFIRWCRRDGAPPFRSDFCDGFESTGLVLTRSYVQVKLTPQHRGQGSTPSRNGGSSGRCEEQGCGEQ